MTETNKKLGEKTEELFELRDMKSELNTKLKDLNRKIDEIQWSIVQEMEEIGIDKLTTEAGTISKKLALYPSIDDKDEFITWAVANDQLGMLVAKANEAVFRAYFEEFNIYPPGTDAFEKIKLNIRRA